MKSNAMNVCLPCLKLEDHQQEKGKGEGTKGTEKKKKKRM